VSQAFRPDALEVRLESLTYLRSFIAEAIPHLIGGQAGRLEIDEQHPVRFFRHADPITPETGRQG
jgi:hypothetical protein